MAFNNESIQDTINTVSKIFWNLLSNLRYFSLGIGNESRNGSVEGVNEEF